MPSRRLGWLLAKDLHELLASRAYWILLLAAGLLTGHAFLTAVDTYAEMSGASGGPAALAEGLSPLEGMVVPTLGALWLTATLLLPFIAIRAIAHEKQTGAWALLVQGPARMRELLSSKLGVLFAAWLFAWLPAAVALLLWIGAGNHLAAAETTSVLLGHALFGWLTIGIAAAAAALMESEASAAVVVLGFTIGTWALDFIGADRGGVAGALAKLTPGAALHSFEHGLVRAAAIVVMLAIGLAGILVAAIWLVPGARPARRRRLTVVVAVVSLAAVAGASRLSGTSDWSEDRRNSFSIGDEAAIREIRQPIRIDVHLAPEDPRLADLRAGLLDKLARIHPGVELIYHSRSETGLFEQADSSYGEVEYTVGARHAISRSSVPAIVLPLVYELAGVAPPASATETYPGYPLVRRPAGIAAIFFVGWPLVWIAMVALRNRTVRPPAAI